MQGLNGSGYKALGTEQTKQKGHTEACGEYILILYTFTKRQIILATKLTVAVGTRLQR